MPSTAASKPIAFICHAGWVPISAGILKGRKATSVDAIRDDMVNAGVEWVDDACVVDGNLISARTPADLGPWMKAVLAALGVKPMIHQLRVYEIFESTKAAFHERFREHAMRIMASYGFDIVAAWETTTRRVEFVYLLEWSDADAMTRSWAGFMADEEWAEIKRTTAARHGQLVGEIEDRVLEQVPYSPSRLG